MLQAKYTKYTLKFKYPSGTSRGVLTEKETWLIKIWNPEQPEIFGLGECAVFRGLSADDRPGYEDKLKEVCLNIHALDLHALDGWDSIRCGVCTALSDLEHGGKRVIYPSPFTEGKKEIDINGLIWMGDKESMHQQIVKKLDAGFHCLKLKIGAIDFESELDLLRAIRSRFGKEAIELRLDANGAFSPEDAPRKLEQLARYDIHSIEQPIRQGQWEEMSRLCRNTPIPIALDEELIGRNDMRVKIALLDTIRPQYIIIKPSLLGGFASSWEWISRARERNIGWWITSALESNIGLNAIAQWTAYILNFHPTGMTQGLGTGQLYTNNFSSSLEQIGSTIRYNPHGNWGIDFIRF